MADGQDRWQTLSAWAVMPIAIRTFTGTLRQYLPALVGVSAGIAVIEGLGLRDLLLLGGGLLLAILLYTLVWRRRFRFRVESSGMRVRQGIFQRRELRVQWSRVRNVDIRQPFYLRPLRLVGLVVETVGAGGEELVVDAIQYQAAEAIREKAGLSRGQASDDEGQEEGQGHAPAGDLLHQPSNGALFVHGLVSGQLWLVLAAMGGIFGTFNRPIMNALEDRWERITAAMDLDPDGWFVASAIVGGLSLVMLLFVLSGLISMIRFHGFELRREGGQLRARHGLLETRERSLEGRKLHAITLIQSPLALWFGRCHLIGHQASSAWDASGSSSELSDGKIVIPGLSLDGGRAILAALDPGYATRPQWHGVDDQFRSFWFQRVWLLFLAVVAVLVWLGLAEPPAAAMALVFALLVLPFLLHWLVHRRWRKWGWAEQSDCFFIQSGLFGYKLEIFNIRRIQQLRLQDSPFKRRHGLVDLAVFLADGPRTIPFRPLASASTQANRILYRLESSPDQLL
ncbi:PH domain-containing protein [Natronospira bacteriovora]|uniref:PH domain-containing protein n=1 Tax=Natronospira bacteriovora TaxID=3069753 RepID=A0ABU0W5C3_9GAMM|nr:PH domain-containing protein [Natronospira sp. AB-CW4]MDQ2069222.1 PH domain-containing protein [Natronospira sp. AB-CW4]